MAYDTKTCDRSELEYFLKQYHPRTSAVTLNIDVGYLGFVSELFYIISEKLISSHDVLDTV